MEAFNTSTWAMPIPFEPYPYNHPSITAKAGLDLAPSVSTYALDLGVDPSSIMTSPSASSVSAASGYVSPGADAAAVFGTSFFSSADAAWALGQTSSLLPPSPQPAPQSQNVARSGSVRSAVSSSSGSASQAVMGDEKPVEGGKPASKRRPRKMTDKRRAQNRDAQRNLRARRQAEAGEHRERVRHLEQQNTELRALVEALRDENSQLRGQIPLAALPAHLIFSCPSSGSPSCASSAMGDLSSSASHSEDDSHHLALYESSAEHSD